MLLPCAPEVPCVASFVEVGLVVPPSPSWPDDEPYVVWDFHCGTKRSRVLPRPVFAVNMYVGVFRGVDPHPFETCVECILESLLCEVSVELLSSESEWNVAAPGF